MRIARLIKRHDRPREIESMHIGRLITNSGTSVAAYQDDRWPPAWGLLAAFFVSALMWWALLIGVWAIANAFMC